jgi:glutamate/aspartate transport system substrate-binding protein
LQRIEDGLEKGTIDVYFGLIRNPEREKKCIFVEPLYTINYILIARADDNAVINSIDDLRKVTQNTKILTVGGSSIVSYIKSLGLQADSEGADVSNNLDKLIVGRARFMIYQDLALFHDMNSPKYKNKFKIIPLTLHKEDLWLVFSKNSNETYRRDIQTVIKKLKASGEWDKIIH